MGQANTEFENRIIIVGVGLIGGSIAAAIQSRHSGCSVIGVGRNAERLESARAAGLLNEWSTEITDELLSGRCLVIVCLPVNLIAESVHEIAKHSDDGVLITDAGSVKSAICDQVATCDRAARLFIGSHPIAGGEQGGFEFADAELFHDKVCVVTECGTSDDATKTDRVTRFWQMIGCRVIEMTPTEHDRVLALTSHLPHVMAAVTTATVGQENLLLTGSGFRDATRIAAGDASLWRAILTGNRGEVVTAIKSAEAMLREYRLALEQNDDDCIQSLLADAANCRSGLVE